MMIDAVTHISHQLLFSVHFVNTSLLTGGFHSLCCFSLSSPPPIFPLSYSLSSLSILQLFVPTSYSLGSFSQSFLAPIHPQLCWMNNPLANAAIFMWLVSQIFFFLEAVRQEWQIIVILFYSVMSLNMAALGCDTMISGSAGSYHSFSHWLFIASLHTQIRRTENNTELTLNRFDKEERCRRMMTEITKFGPVCSVHVWLKLNPA